MNALSNMGADRFMNRLFRRADGVVWDLMTGKVGIVTKEGIATLNGEGDDAQIEINMIEQFGMEIPAFAQSTPVEAVKAGDIIYFGATDRPGWVVEKKGEVGKPISFILMKADGTRSTWKPPKVSMLGLESGVMVLRSLLSMLPGGNSGLAGMQGMLMPMLMMGGDMDMDKMMPLLLMGQMGAQPVVNPDGTTTAPPVNPMAQMMPMMLMMSMMKGGDSPFSSKKSPFKG
jgi:hypothetical protein